MNTPDKEVIRMAEPNNNPNNEPSGQKMTFDEFLAADKENQAEFDRRVNKALDTAKGKWNSENEKASKKLLDDAEAAKKQAVADAVKAATDPLNSALTDAMMMAAIARSDARDPDDIMRFIDKSKISRSDDGKITGLDEQMEALKGSKAYLFRGESGGEGKKPGASRFNHAGNPPANDDLRSVRIAMGLPVD